MKFLTAITALASVVSALPTEDVRARQLIESHEQTMEYLKARAWDTTGETANELLDGGACPPVIWIYARGSTEGGNLGSLGGRVGKALENSLGAANVWVQGVGGAYNANLLDNLLSKGTTDAAINEMKNLLSRASTQCPNAKILAGGYSQGAALAGEAISTSSAAIRDKIKGVVLFGWTKNQQWNGAIPNYPSNRLKVYCESGDLVCTGTLIVTPAHSTYKDEAEGVAPQFLISKL
ncbi:family 5 putative carbohydrate esterase [Podospora fimiseda]|uniref:cutinase n=1 Tax=Podospora fimiseda TaxID=252190 RepID=A0AAN7BR02_9PEZI|nr:family 5 putative carbohydrate esterase [Podospora fimiseda]